MQRKFEFFVLRYVPQTLRDDWVSFGVVMIEVDAGEAGFADVRFTRDWRRVLDADPAADIEILQAMESDIRMQLADLLGRDAMLKRMQESFSSTIQLSPIRGCLTDDPEKEIELLVTLLCDPLRPTRVERQPTGRRAIFSQMIEAFEQANVRKLLMTDIAVSGYTKSGDPMKLDFGYRTKSEMKFLQAVSLKSSEEPAILLASRFPEVSRYIQFATGLPVVLTAVVDDDIGSADATKTFALDYLREKQIQVVVVAEMPRIATQVSQELVP